MSRTVYGVTVPPDSQDSLRYQPIAGATIAMIHNVLTKGAASQVLVTTLTTAANGSFNLSNLPGGYDILDVTPPVNSIFVKSWTYLPATKAQVTVNPYLWQRP